MKVIIRILKLLTLPILILLWIAIIIHIIEFILKGKTSYYKVCEYVKRYFDWVFITKRKEFEPSLPDGYDYEVITMNIKPVIRDLTKEEQELFNKKFDINK